ncbi:MAG: putative ABC transporter permease [Clostridiales bacterium]|nr:putative ABC transporter permease [Clostridiales bacterium]
MSEVVYTILGFFLFSFLGWVMECIVITYQDKKITNRGFVRGPFCIIYGFGSLIGYRILSPLMGHLVILFLAGAISATLFELLTAKVMLRLFGEFWWDYSNKPFNYKGILCLESTLAWGAIAVLLCLYLHDAVLNLVTRISYTSAFVAATILTVTYVIDFVCSFYQVMKEKHRDKINSFLENPFHLF